MDGEDQARQMNRSRKISSKSSNHRKQINQSRIVKMSFKFTCKSCGQIHEGIPTFGADSPLLYHTLSPNERESRAVLGTDNCIIDNERFLIRGCLEIPVHGEMDPFIWGVWVDISEKDYETYEEVFEERERSNVGPFGGYLGTFLPIYPDTMNLIVRIYLRDNGIGPYIEVYPIDHPLYSEQQNGISYERLAEIYGLVMHGK